jgi:hypothetical protein
VQIRLSRGLARHGMTASWCCMMRAACCRLASSSLFCHSIFQFKSRHSTAMFPLSVLGFPIWHVFMPGVVLYCPILKLDLGLRKRWFPQLPGNNYQSTCQESPSQFATARFPHRIQSQVSKTGLCTRLCSLFRAPNVAAYRPGA